MYYVLSDGRLTQDKTKALVDTIRNNLTLDVSDVPVAHYGILQNFSKDNMEDSILLLKLMVTDFLMENQLNDLRFYSVEYKNNQFVVNFIYNDSLLSVGLNN